ncbi:hypothetical protein COMNV_01349 [Commensalibacter sp. Nvir]|uniref:hypothetical protein n=1 Tax=Commensalibacter sp. Nvir TaxID=3069817 RepID=UPI002D22EE60|nr:hypothetical protein COMNV_01349 [Commensalibacter sp. Nvir]
MVTKDLGIHSPILSPHNAPFAYTKTKRLNIVIPHYTLCIRDTRLRCLFLRRVTIHSERSCSVLPSPSTLASSVAPPYPLQPLSLFIELTLRPAFSAPRIQAGQQLPSSRGFVHRFDVRFEKKSALH